MKKYLLLLLFITTVTVHAQVTFQKTFGGAGSEAASSIQQTLNGDYVITGYTQSYGAGIYDVFLVKFNGNGEYIWSKTFGGINYDIGSVVDLTSDGRYIIGGNTISFGAGGSDVFLIKTDSAGDSLWTKTYGGTGNDYLDCLRETYDGGYIIVGHTYRSTFNEYDVYIIKTDSSGDSLWAKCFGGSNNDYGVFVEQTSDSGYIITGITNSFGAGGDDVFLTKTDVNGNIIWTKTFGGSGSDKGNSVEQTGDGGFIIGGYTSSFGAGNYDLYLIKTDQNGDSIWTKTFGGQSDDIHAMVHLTSDGGFIVTGTTSSFGAGINDLYFIKLDSNGDTIWTKSYGGTDYETGAGMQTFDGGYIIAGWTASFGAGNADFYIVKTDENGINGCYESGTSTIGNSTATQVSTPFFIVNSPNTSITNPPTIVGSGGLDSTICSSVYINEIALNNSFVIFPNPAEGKLTISSVQFPIKAIAMMNMLGEHMFAVQLPTANCQLPIELDISELTPGIYFVIVLSEKGSAVQKLVVQ